MSTMNQFPSQLPPNTIVPENWDLFIPYFNTLYEDIASTVNGRDFHFLSHSYHEYSTKYFEPSKLRGIHRMC